MTIKIYNDSNKIKLLNNFFIYLGKKVNHCHCVKVVLKKTDERESPQEA